MRFALIGLLCLGFAVAVVLIVGSLLPRSHVASRVAVYHASPEVLFSLMIGAQDWRSEKISAEATTDAAGRKWWRETTQEGGTMLYEVLVEQAPVLLRRRIEMEKLPYGGSWTYALRSVVDGTEVRITEEGEIYNPVFRFMSRFFLGYTQSIDNYLRALGAALKEQIFITDIVTDFGEPKYNKGNLVERRKTNCNKDTHGI